MTTTAAPASTASNVVSASGTVVHAGTWVRASHVPEGWLEAQACGNARNAIAYGFPTDRPVTCKRCLGSTVLPVTPEVAAERRAAKRAADKAFREDSARRIAEMRAAATAKRVAWLTGRLAEVTAAGDTAAAAAITAEIARQS